jgi:hypothetical protein
VAKKKPQGHYCVICGQRKANEKFSGKGHAAHIETAQKLSKSWQSTVKYDIIKAEDKRTVRRRVVCHIYRVNPEIN